MHISGCLLAFPFFSPSEKASCYFCESSGGCNFLAQQTGATERTGKFTPLSPKKKMSGKLCKSHAKADFISHVYMTIYIYREHKIGGKTGWSTIGVWKNQHVGDGLELISHSCFGGEKKRQINRDTFTERPF